MFRYTLYGPLAAAITFAILSDFMPNLVQKLEGGHLEGYICVMAGGLFGGWIGSLVHKFYPEWNEWTKYLSAFLGSALAIIFLIAVKVIY